MNDTIAPRSWLQNIVVQGQQQLEHIDSLWLEKIRQAACNDLATLQLPERKQEIWRYSNINKLFKDSFIPWQPQQLTHDELKLKAQIIDGLDSYRLVMLNGQIVSELSTLSDLPDGVMIDSLANALSKYPQDIANWFHENVKQHSHVFTALNTALANDGCYVHLKKGIVLDKPIEIINICDSQDDKYIFQPRNLYVFEEQAQATLIERFMGVDQSAYFINNLSELVLAEDARLNHYLIQEESDQAYHLSSIFLKQQSQSEYRNISLAAGGAWARTEFHVDFQEPGAQCHLNGLYTIGAQQLIDFHLDIRHKVPDCVSSENFKGIVYGSGRGVFDGLIFVDKNAQGTEAHLANANLILARNAHVDTKPQLEIYADDVKCSHGTTVGQLEDQQVFYLRSRGIDEQTARSMLCLGFVAEILNGITIDSLKNYISSMIKARLQSALSVPTP